MAQIMNIYLIKQIWLYVRHNYLARHCLFLQQDRHGKYYITVTGTNNDGNIKCTISWYLETKRHKIPYALLLYMIIPKCTVLFLEPRLHLSAQILLLLHGNSLIQKPKCRSVTSNTDLSKCDSQCLFSMSSLLEIYLYTWMYIIGHALVLLHM